jgi:sulfatase maturation enzyme AslB (radical SAM superfamily)
MSILKDVLHGFVSKFYPVKPFGAVFVVTDHCNARCRMCDIWKHKGNELSLETFENYLKSPVLTRIVNAAFTGGEPTLRKDLAQFFERLLTSCPDLESVNISTNALLPERLESLMTQFVDIRNRLNPRVNILVQISLDGPEGIHEKVRCVPNAYRTVMDSVERIRRIVDTENKFDQYFLCVLQPENIDHLDELEELFRELDRPVTYNVLCDASYVLTDRAICPRMSAEQTRKLIAFLTKMIHSGELDFRHRYHYNEIVEWFRLQYRPRPCGIITQHMIVNSDGQLLPCLNSGEISYPELKVPDDLARFWGGAERKKINRRITRELCPGCRASCGPNIFDASLALLTDSLRQKLRLKN